MIEVIKRRKLAFLIFSLLAACSIAVASLALQGQANKAATLTGIEGINTEMATGDMLKAPSKGPQANIDWNKAKAYKNKLDANTKEYTKYAEKAKAEIDASGAVEANTRDKGLELANKFKAISDEYAAFLTKGNCITRGKVVAQIGDARIKNADVTFNAIDEEKIKAYQEELDKLSAARKDYLAEAKNDLSDADKASIKSDIVPRLQTIVSNVAGIAKQVTDMISQLKDEVLSGGVGGLVSCARDASASDNPAQALLSPLSSLLTAVEGLGTNVQDAITDISSL